MNHLRIDTRDIPDSGLRLSGEMPPAIFELAEDDSIRAVGPLKYDCELTMASGALLVCGDFEASFELECVRCAERFVHPVHLIAHVLHEDLENRTILDLTTSLREDILLALPAYPHCDQGPDARVCPAAGRFPTEDRFIPVSTDDRESPPLSRGNVWDALNALKKKPES